MIGSSPFSRSNCCLCQFRSYRTPSESAFRNRLSHTPPIARSASRFFTVGIPSIVRWALSPFFLNEPLCELKALKTSVARLSYRLGKFLRVYAAGTLSTSAATAFLDATTDNPRGRFIPRPENGEILAFRMLSILRLQHLTKEAQAVAQLLAVHFSVGAVSR